MGSCCCKWRSKSKESLLKNKKSKNKNTGKILIKTKLPNDIPEEIGFDWKKEIDDYWNMPPSKLAIHTDLPRLAHKFHIIDKNGVDLTPDLEQPYIFPIPEKQLDEINSLNDEKSRNEERIVFNIILALSKALGDEFTYNFFIKEWWNFFPFVIK